MTDSKKDRPSSPRGHFLKNGITKGADQERLRPEVAGILSAFYAGHRKHVAVLADLTKTMSNPAEINRLNTIKQYIAEAGRSSASKIKLEDWQRRISSETKRAFSLLGIAQLPGAHAITFRLGYEVAESALAAPEGAPAYLAALIKRKFGITTIAFTLEYLNSTSNENHPLHIHGVACIPAGMIEDDIRAVLAPEPTKPSLIAQTPNPVRGYRQRYENKAIDMQPIRTPGAWAGYCNKEYLATARKLRAAPDYASHTARRAGKELYEEVAAWIRSRSAQQAAHEAADEEFCSAHASDSLKASGYATGEPGASQDYLLDELERVMAELDQ